MLRTAGFVFIACCALSALPLADARKSKPSATVSPASDFDTSSIAPKSTTTATTTSPHNTTTTATTTSPHNTTTTATTTSPHNTTTTATTTPPHNTTTTATTTSPHNTTTTATTTPSHNTTTTATTTPSHNTTTTATTTEAPTTASPSPASPVGDYNLTNDKKETCLKAQVALQIRLVTTKANGSFIVQPKETSPNGTCDETRVTLYLNFKQGFINFNFTRSVANDTVYVDAVAFKLSYPLGRGRLAGASYSVSNASLHLFPAKIGHSYSCRSDSLYMGNGLYLDVTHDKMQAFNLTKNDFGSPDPCPADKPDYRVAIGVGVTLLVLIVVVVVAYLLSRRKRMEGYQSL